MSLYIIHTISKINFNHENVKVSVQKTSLNGSDRFNLRIESISDNYIQSYSHYIDVINDLNEKCIYIPVEFNNILKSSNYSEVVLFKNGEIYSTEWKYSELDVFDNSLYNKKGYEIISYLKENKIKYNFKNKHLEISIKKNINYDLFLDLTKPLKETFEELNKGEKFKIEKINENTIIISIIENDLK
jgi:hypothetical protein